MTPYSDPDMRRKAARDSMARRRLDPAVREAEAEAKRVSRENSRTMNQMIARSRGEQIQAFELPAPPPNPTHQAVNKVIFDAYNRGHTVGDMASRAAGEATPTERGEQLAALEHELEQLKASGATPGEIELANRAVEALLAEARANSARPRGEDGRFITAESFDGGACAARLANGRGCRPATATNPQRA